MTMLEYYGVCPATPEEIAMYKKVERAFDNDEEAYERMLDLNLQEDLGDLLKNRVRGEELKKILRSHKITMKEFCTWYFID